ncbi:hypothetical protein A7975_27430 [Bacillus sp. FJAT-26390]|nr:hypothetical protein A7975_27430 [Bacillus sp. FJAT-26390]
MSVVMILCYLAVALIIFALVASLIVIKIMIKKHKGFNKEYSAAEAQINLTKDHMRNRTCMILW